MRTIVYVNEYKDADVKYILKKVFAISSSLISKLKQNNGIYVNGDLCTVRKLCDVGDEIKLDIPYFDNPAIVSNNIKCTILYEDEDVICFDKPANMPTHPSAGHHNDTLANCALNYLRKNKDEYHVVTRLDRYTSGIVLVAKNAYSASVMCTKDYNSKIYKEYEGICRGRFETKEGTVEEPIGRCCDSVIKHCVSPRGKHAKTDYEFIGTTSCGNSHMRFRLHTGRTHQIRVHMQHIGHSLVDDFLYDDFASENGFFCLHCTQIRFVHPFSKKEITVVSKAPSYFNHK